MRVVTHNDLSLENRYQAYEYCKDGKVAYAFSDSRMGAISKLLKILFCAHIFRISPQSRTKKCLKCNAVKNEQ